jgi:hypothetical protein
METVTVNAQALRELLQAVIGEPHLIHELQVTRTLPELVGSSMNPIDVLITEYNNAANVYRATLKGD